METGKEYFAMQRALWVKERGLSVSADLSKRIEQALPDGWETRWVESWGPFGGLLVIAKDAFVEIPMEEFGLACKLIEMVTGKKPKVDPWTEGAALFCIMGTVELPVKWWDVSSTLKIQARIFKPKDCKLEYETKTVTVAKVPEGCLGVAGIAVKGEGE